MISCKHLFLHQQRKRNELTWPYNMESMAQHPVGSRSHRLVPTLLLLLLLVCVSRFLLMVLLPKFEWIWIQQNIAKFGTLSILFHLNSCCHNGNRPFDTVLCHAETWPESLDWKQGIFFSKTALKQGCLPQTGHGGWLPMAACCTDKCAILEGIFTFLLLDSPPCIVLWQSAGLGHRQDVRNLLRKGRVSQAAVFIPFVFLGKNQSSFFNLRGESSWIWVSILECSIQAVWPGDLRKLT